MIGKLSKTPNIFNLDDEKLIDKFVQGSNQLLASENMRLEVSGSLSQLISRNGDSIAISFLQAKPRTIVVKQTSPFLNLIDRTLQQHDFVSIGDAKQSGFIEYRHYVTPAGYKIWHTDPAILWKKWWPTERFQNKQRFNMDILVSYKDNWYPVQDISVHSGTFIIKTIAGKFHLKRNDRVIWLAQILDKDLQSNNNSTLQPATSSDHSPPFTAGVSPDFLSSPTRLTTSIALEASTSIPKEEPNRTAELEQRLQAEIQAKTDMEEKLIEAEQRALIAEQRLQIAYKYLHQMGISPQDIYIKKV